MGSLNSFDIKIAIFFKKCFDYYIRKRSYTPDPPTQDEIWESLFNDADNFVFDLDNEIRTILFKDSKLCKLIYFGFYENEFAFLRKYLKEGDVFFDIGANIGLYSLFASKIIGDNSKVFAFEPTPDTFERLQKNIRLNKLTNIKPYNIGLSSEKSELDLHISKDGYDAWNSFALLDELTESETLKVNVDTIDSFIQTNNIVHVDLVKIDVEGWEKYVLKGATDLLKMDNSPVFLIEFTEENAFAAGYYLGEIYDFMTDLGYYWYSYDKDSNNLIKEMKKLHYPYENLIAIKNLKKCLKRISE